MRSWPVLLVIGSLYSITLSIDDNAALDDSFGKDPVRRIPAVT
jgi:hypothetical protein